MGGSPGVRPRAGCRSSEALRQAAAGTALGRLVTEEDVARAALFLASDLSSGVTGALAPGRRGAAVEARRVGGEGRGTRGPPRNAEFDDMNARHGLTHTARTCSRCRKANIDPSMDRTHEVSGSSPLGSAETLLMRGFFFVCGAM